jgi:lambda family phage portal protein
MQVQVLEPEMCPLLDADTYVGLPASNIIRSGIELNNRGKRVAYWFYKQHPGDPSAVMTYDANDLVRVAASDVCHVFQPLRAGQMRGVPMVAPILAKLRNIGDYEDAVLERQKIANLFVAFITKALPKLDPNDPVQSALGDQLVEVIDDLGQESAPLAPMAPGLMQELDDGQSVTFANPPEAGTMYSEYMRTSHLGSAAASGLPYELYSGDIQNISDRTLRVLINEFRRLAEQRQWQILIPQFCQRLVEWFADAAALIGLVSIDELPLVKRCTHSPHGWEYIHPVQDVQGRALAVLNGFESRAQVVGERGDDIETVDDERAADQQREVDLGLRPDPTAMPDPNAGESQGQSGNQQQGDQQQTQKAFKQLQASMHELQALIDARAPANLVAQVRAVVAEQIAAIGSDD